MSIKLDFMLGVLLEGKSLTTAEAQDYKDTCFNTTVSQLKKHPIYKVDIKDKWETIETGWGTTTQVKRYWIDNEERMRLQQIRNKLKETIKDKKQKKRSTV